MAKSKEEVLKQQALEQENILLKQRIEALESTKPEMINALGDGVLNEMRKIRQKGRAGGNRIEIHEQNDHTNIALWTKWGKRIGPLHPDNAIQTLNRFADIGVVLTVDKPTPEQTEAWSNSPEGKRFWKKEAERRAIKDKSRRSGQMDRLSAEIAKMTGTTVDAINYILKPGEVKNK